MPLSDRMAKVPPRLCRQARFDEVLAHFTRDMGKHIPLTRKIDTEHGAGQDLSHCAFGYDLFFFRHRAANIRGNASLSRLTLFSTELVQRERWQIFVKLLAFPPRAGLATLVHCCEAVSIKHGSDVARRFIGEWIACQQGAHILRALE